MPKWAKWTLGIFGLLVVISIATGGASTNTTNSPAVTQTAAGDTDAAKPSSGGTHAKTATCGSRATDGCTPHVGPNDSVRVDALIWRLASVRQAKTIGDRQYGLGEKANGVFLVLDLRVHSDKDESATLIDSTIKLETGGNTYDADSDGTIAAMGAGQEPFFLDTIGPDSDRRGTVVFDVPRNILDQKLEIRFNELGFGSTHGYIRLPGRIPASG
jgi:Domain of unknown function (DUF4352)